MKEKNRELTYIYMYCLFVIVCHTWSVHHSNASALHMNDDSEWLNGLFPGSKKLINEVFPLFPGTEYNAPYLFPRTEYNAPHVLHLFPETEYWE